MNTPFIALALALPSKSKARLLLAEFCPVKIPDLHGDLSAERLSQRAIAITSVLKKIIAPRGWAHGGINE